MERKAWLHWCIAYTPYKYYGEEAFFYGGSGRKDSRTAKLQELSERFGKQTSGNGRSGKGSAGSGGISWIDEDYEESVKAYDNIIRDSVTIGISYSDLMDMDIKRFNRCVDGYIAKREISMNDTKTVEHIIAGKIAEAVWGDKHFKKPIKEIKLDRVEEEDLKEKSKRKVMETLKRKGLI